MDIAILFIKATVKNEDRNIHHAYGINYKIRINPHYFVFHQIYLKINAVLSKKKIKIQGPLI